MENDQTIKADAGKARLSLVPFQIVWDIARVREFGVKKYSEGGKDNWKKVDVERYRDAMLRHMFAYIDNPDAIDEESGLPALWHVFCNAAFLSVLEKERYKKVTSHTKPITEWTIEGKSIVASPETGIGATIYTQSAEAAELTEQHVKDVLDGMSNSQKAQAEYVARQPYDILNRLGEQYGEKSQQPTE